MDNKEPQLLIFASKFPTMSSTLGVGAGGTNAKVLKPNLNSSYLIWVTVARIINLLHVKWNVSEAQEVLLALFGDRGHKSIRKLGHIFLKKRKTAPNRIALSSRVPVLMETASGQEFLPSQCLQEQCSPGLILSCFPYRLSPMSAFWSPCFSSSMPSSGCRWVGTPVVLMGQQLPRLSLAGLQMLCTVLLD